MRRIPNNLSPNAQPWARELENTINSLSRKVMVAEQRNSNAFSASNATLRGLEEQITALKESGIVLQPGKLTIEGNFQVPDGAISNSSLEYPVSVIISETEPPQDPTKGWWNPNDGSLSRWDQSLQEWVPAGVPVPWNGHYAVALGGASPPNGSSGNSVALGYTNDPAGTGSVLIGSDLTSNNNGYSPSWAVVLGYQSQGNASMVSVIGYQAQATGNSASALGHQANAGGSSASALGHQANAAGAGSVAIGYNATAQGGNSVSVGYNAVTEDNNIAIGQSATSTGTSGSLTIGQYATAQGGNSVSVGGLSLAGSITDGEATAIGAGAVAAHRGSISLGYGSTSIAEDETVIHTNALNVLQPSPDTETSIVIQSPDGTPWRIKVDNSGVLSTELA